VAGASASSARSPRILIAGGFTGGHLFTAVAIAEAIRRRAPAAEIRLGGTRGGMELGLARDAGLSVETVWLDGIARGRSLQALARNCALPVKLAVALGQARAVVERFRPDVVVGVGAYVSFPFVAMAQWRGVPTLLHEANAVPGVANALLSRWTDVICVGLADAGPHFPGVRRARRIVETGTPVRPELAGARALTPAEARARLGLDPGRRTLLVVGGSLGSSALNAWMSQEGRRLGLDHGLDDQAMQILWQCGRAHLGDCRARLGDAPGVVLVPFLDDVGAAYVAADLVIAGAGAATLSELALFAKAALIVPDRAVSEDHQLANAQAVGRAGAAAWTDRALGAAFTARVRALWGDAEALQSAAAALARLGRPHADEAVAAEVLGLARPSELSPGA
jgi:UDP-N-acetylglucosamine--N-acetylmuramyl-(pentapeptide) pyrophosphoryl-undecaprenol N-acetylglucosamine transferase